MDSKDEELWLHVFAAVAMHAIYVGLNMDDDRALAAAIIAKADGVTMADRAYKMADSMMEAAKTRGYFKKA